MQINPISDRFSPVAGIQWVETRDRLGNASDREKSFSPVAGIQWVETRKDQRRHRHDRYVSVPLPGFSGLRHPLPALTFANSEFQSRCRDSVG